MPHWQGGNKLKSKTISICEKSSCTIWANSPDFIYFTVFILLWWWHSIPVRISALAPEYSTCASAAVPERPLSVGMQRIWLWYFEFVSFEPSETDKRRVVWGGLGSPWTFIVLTHWLLTQQTKALLMYLLGGRGKINTLNGHPAVQLSSAQSQSTYIHTYTTRCRVHRSQ